MRALVTGGCGFIGSNLVHALCDEGWKVDVVDDLSNGSPMFLEGLNARYIPNIPLAMSRLEKEEKDQVKVFTMDFASHDVLQRVLKGTYDIVFHLAANPRVEYSVENPTLTTEVNLYKTVALMECAAKSSVKRFVFSSTCAVYGDATTLPTLENAEISPNSPYGLQKYSVERFAQLLSKTHGLDSICLRYFNVYGPRQLGGSPYSTAITAWTHNAFHNMPLRSDGDGTQTRDLVYVGDVVRANVLAAKSSKTFAGNCVNIATGKSISNLDLIEKFRGRFNDIEVNTAPWRPGDVMHTLAGVSFARSLLGFESETGIDEGLQKTWSWWEKKK